MPIIKIHNVETDDVIEREMTAEEVAQWEADQAAAQAKRQAEAEAEAKKVAAKAKLAVLGLDEDDLRALGL